MRRKFFVLSFLCAVLASGCAENAGSVTVEKNRQASPFTLKDIAGNSVSLEVLFQGKKAVLLNFWATWCPPCREEIPDLVKLHERLNAKGVSVVGVDVGESAEKVAAFMKKQKIGYPVLLDSDSKVTGDYGVVGIPTTFLITPDGQIHGTYHAYTAELVREAEKFAA